MFTLAITKMAGAAFDEYPQDEVTRILRLAAEMIENGREHAPLFDINGNRVGEYRLDMSESH